MNDIEQLVCDLPDPAAARRFLDEFSARHPTDAAKLRKKQALLSDALTLAAFSPLLAATMLQNPKYLSWLDTHRALAGVCSRDELLESLARFSMTNSLVETQVMLARFRRRELLRIFLKDIRRLATIAEITEEISNLADAVLEHALRVARQALDNRWGPPTETDKKGRSSPARFCIVALGKLGSRELNYASDIDLLFLYSAEGKTSGSETITNREYFIKLAESIIKIVGEQVGEGAVYRVDLRLRPHGRVGPLALSVTDTVRYYATEAQAWERQVLIRSRPCAGDADVFKQFFSRVQTSVFSEAETVKNALANVRLSKEKIDRETGRSRDFNVKLGRGGIREIEFIAQALQLAYGGSDKWLRTPHTLISLTRLADRGLIREVELTELFDAYEFLRQLEHILQLKHGLQTHSVPGAIRRRELAARRMGFETLAAFDAALQAHTSNVNRIFTRVFGPAETATGSVAYETPQTAETGKRDVLAKLALSFDKSEYTLPTDPEEIDRLRRIAETSPRFSEMLAANPELIESLHCSSDLAASHSHGGDFRSRIAALRKDWSRRQIGIIAADVFQEVDLKEVKRRQTELAESSLNSALTIVRDELGRRYGRTTPPLDLAVLALGKFGGGAIDYDSDLDLVLVHSDNGELPDTTTAAEYYARAAELLVTGVSAMTRDGSLYRIDLRLRPFGSDGPLVSSYGAFRGYMSETAAIWEMLAFVKLRAVGGDIHLARQIEQETRETIHGRALTIDPAELAGETRRVRLQLEKQKAARSRSKDIDIKYGLGGLLDVYFAMRYLQLRDDVRDNPADRSTTHMLKALRERGSLSADDFANLSKGYEFLSALDHQLRLTSGRSSRIPLANKRALETCAARLGLVSVNDILEHLTIHRLNIRASFDRLLDQPANSVSHL